MSARKFFMGMDGFVWWMGVVEDRMDPDKLGRVRVRIFGLHTESLELIPSTDLPWAYPILAPNAPSLVSTPKEGDVVFGFFMDGESCQYPALLGIIPGIPESILPTGQGFTDQRTSFDNYPGQGYKALGQRYPNRLNESTLNRLSRNEKLDNTVIELIKKNKLGPEPDTSYNAVYPFNNALESESGHALELDDTPSAERVQLSHRSGSYIEMRPDGSRVDKITKDRYQIVAGEDNLFISGNCTITVEGDLHFIAGGAIRFDAHSGHTFSSDSGAPVSVETNGGFHCSSTITSSHGGTGDISTPTGIRISVTQGTITDVD